MRAGCFKPITYSALAVLASFLLAISAQAQSNGTNSSGFTVRGVPPSVTSFGFGEHPGFHGVPASVTSPNFGNIPFRMHSGFEGFRHHRHNSRLFNPFFGDVVSVPYAYPVYLTDPGYVMEPGVDDSMEEDYRGGPTIFDRRGPGTREYSRPQPSSDEEDYRKSSRTEQPQAQPSPAHEDLTPQPETVLVFKDGHQLQVSNYAIVGATLYDLEGSRARKVPLVDLDLTATMKQNDDRGVDFRLPAGLQLN